MSRGWKIARLTLSTSLGIAFGYGLFVDGLVGVLCGLVLVGWFLWGAYALWPGRCQICGRTSVVAIPTRPLPARAWWDLRPLPRLSREYACEVHVGQVLQELLVRRLASSPEDP